jgi:hypothetical protein
MVTGGQSLKKVYDLLCTGSGCKGILLTFWIMIFASVHLSLSQFPNFNSISAVSAAAAVMSLTYSMIASFTSVLKGASTTAAVID